MTMANALILLLSLIALFVFFIPSLIAYSRESRQRLIILIANIAVGWTGIGWLAVLAVAVWPRGDAVPVAITSFPDGVFPRKAQDTAQPTQSQAKAGPQHRIERLKGLAELRDAGVLSEDEFNQKKQEILAAL